MPSKSVIHIDDSREMRVLTQRAVGKCDPLLQYRGTESGAEGLRWIEQLSDRANLVLILDVHMPEMTGLEILQELKNRGLRERFPIIMLSTSEQAEDRERCLALGATRFCIKPVDWDQLVDVLKQYLSVTV
jgi:CheY-like chemotaxis protein